MGYSPPPVRKVKGRSLRERLFKIRNRLPEPRIRMGSRQSAVPYKVLLTKRTDVVVSVPCYGETRFLRHAVESILEQTHKNLVVVVVNDGGPSPWHLLKHIDDPRLVRFDLPVNRGRYFCDSVVLYATKSPYMLIQDADDWSSHDRLSSLFRAMRRTRGAVAAVSDIQRGSSLKSSRGIVKGAPSSLCHLAPHVALFSTKALRDIGGNYRGYRVGYDTFLMNVLRILGPIAYVPRSLYYARIRPTSLTRSAETGVGSTYRRQVWFELNALYQRIRTSSKLSMIQKLLPAQDREIALYAGRLSKCLP
jgi:glycosyltransferase involved in cell wall biosynthesis